MAKKQKVEPEDEQLEERAPEGEQESDSREEEQPPAEEPAPEKPVQESTHLHLEGLGFVEHIDAGHHERAIVYSGRNFEHVGEVDGIWSYRRM